ncbi:4854_t:CDS:2 [Ambispora leptoticha]|uniref:4854_t:CDS:1 n=1 Tax=Ambispora leptoticha TaxID=144679 RepID=A0A9N9GB20_9GLOM|nr:4854_t:CDS:2 [Ambispora leptoticha]
MSKTHLLKLNCSCKNKKIVAYLSSHDCPEYKSLYSASIICSECKIQGSSGFKFECYMDDCLNLRNDNDFSCYHCLYKHFGDKHLLCKACNPNGIGICKECYNDTSQSQRKCNQHCELKILKLSTGNNCLDEFIYKTQQNSRGLIDWLDWIDYKQFSDITFLAEGGFANVYLAEWKEGPPSQYQCWYVPIGRNRNTNTKVVLKSLKNSKNMTKEFLNELDTHHKCLGGLHNSLRCYGVTFIPEQNEYALVLKYAQNGNIRQYIQKENENLTWYRRVELLEGIVDNLKHIHSKNFIHGDLHSGNVLKGKLVLEGYISDLGMSRPVDDSKPTLESKTFIQEPFTQAD